jgi:hypothetical protein
VEREGFRAILASDGLTGLDQAILARSPRPHSSDCQTGTLAHQRTETDGTVRPKRRCHCCRASRLLPRFKSDQKFPIPLV